ncbi:MAG: RNA polymerase sigma factor [Acidimicrobiales bacterium]
MPPPGVQRLSTGLDTTALALSARDGDDAAFEQLVRATYADTYTLAYRLLSNEEDARDVTQEVYLRAYRGLGRFRGDAQVTTWLHRITANTAMSQRSRRLRHRHERLDADLAVVDGRAEHDPAGKADADDLRTRVEGALRELPARLRAVVVLRDVYDLTHEAIAAELGISETAAKVRLHRARRKLRERLFAEEAGRDL